MKRIFAFIFALLLGAALLTASRTRADSQTGLNDQQPTNGAYRDGVYLGKLAASRGDVAHIATGRWATAADRTAFSAGYQQGYASQIGAKTGNSVSDPSANTRILAS